MANDPIVSLLNSLQDADDDMAIEEDDSHEPHAQDTGLGAYHAHLRDRFGASRAHRRTLLNRSTQGTSAVPTEARSGGSRPESSTGFNPHAAEFVPRTPSKRKASSSARPNKSTHPVNAPVTARSATGVAGQPSIPWNELFGFQPRTLPTNFTLEEMDEEEADELITLDQDLSAEDQDELQRVIRLRRSLRMKQAAGNSWQTSAAILFSPDDGAEYPSEASHSTGKLRYLPIGPESLSRWENSDDSVRSFTVLRGHRQYIDDASASHIASRASWPPGRLPVELFEAITHLLSRDDIMCMRLVSKEFEKKVSSTLFHTSVVPFNTELYDMIEEDAKMASRSIWHDARPPGKGKGKARDVSDHVLERVPGSLHWQNAREDAEGKVYKGHGLRVFKGFGPHIRKFGMSFEVAETQLSRPPVKRELDHVVSYYGSYDWPQQQYARFANLAGLEKTADDTLRMKAAFSNLDKVQELALSLDSGLGWLNGPDKSVHSHIFERPTPVFGLSRSDHRLQDSRDFWSALQASHRSHGRPNVLKEANLMYQRLPKAPAGLQGLEGTRYGATKFWPSISTDQVMPALGPATWEEPSHGVAYMTTTQPGSSTTSLYDKSALVPAELRKEQKEWLLETEWAQRAFLECYMLAVIDNSALFANVKTLKLSKLSSSFLPLVGRESFWDALPGLSTVEIHVKPDWRVVEKDNAGYAETSTQSPSEAVHAFHQFVLKDRLCLRPSVKHLNIGWVGGGEHAVGIFARNANILPCPISQLEHSTAATAHFGLIFEYVEHLTLTNCWITPPALQEMVKNHAGKSLKTLTLDSVSLTSHPRFPAGGQQQQMAQAMAGLQQGNLQAFGLGAPQGQVAPAVQQNAQPAGGHLAQMQHMQAQMQALHQLLPHGHQHNVPQNQLQMQAQLQALQAALMNAGQPAALPPPAQVQNPIQNQNVQQNPQNQPAPSHWTDGHREGSWPDVINDISPGTIFTDYVPQPQPWETQLPPRAVTNLQTIEFKSCGYARLINNHAFDQFWLDTIDTHHLSVWFRTRQGVLAPAMMTTSDPYIARIVQNIPQRELDALLFAWGLTEGWADREKAEEAEFDGLLAGGTGRFSGKVEVGMALVGQPASAEGS
ncbi:Hypothetical predicted protein [Lecanosticta acicola]|uniref:F-box domain-containing protein n=1 Tax=Lecanosticta acicola TaxID=111012 RepID=A0AAI8Z0L4_9PEZI|nr:Hypothetical predicted protein [Lecanosticta acicola]